MLARRSWPGVRGGYRREWGTNPSIKPAGPAPTTQTSDLDACPFWCEPFVWPLVCELTGVDELVVMFAVIADPKSLCGCSV